MSGSSSVSALSVHAGRKVGLDERYMSISPRMRELLREADMSGAQLDAAVLTGADLRNANLRGAGFRNARLDGTDLRDARLGSTLLVGASLRGADLRGAYLRLARLDDADLSDPNLDGTEGLTQAQLNRADYMRNWLLLGSRSAPSFL